MRASASLSSASRVVFPLEVKLGAVRRIEEGDKLTAVARDLGCPVSTVASWWNRKDAIVAASAAEEEAASSAELEVSMAFG
jgi:transposase-like protein